MPMLFNSVWGIKMFFPSYKFHHILVYTCFVDKTSAVHIICQRTGGSLWRWDWIRRACDVMYQFISLDEQLFVQLTMSFTFSKYTVYIAALLELWTPFHFPRQDLMDHFQNLYFRVSKSSCQRRANFQSQQAFTMGSTSYWEHSQVMSTVMKLWGYLPKPGMLEQMLSTCRDSKKLFWTGLNVKMCAFLKTFLRAFVLSCLWTKSKSTWKHCLTLVSWIWAMKHVCCVYSTQHRLISSCKGWVWALPVHFSDFLSVLPLALRIICQCDFGFCLKT